MTSLRRWRAGSRAGSAGRTARDLPGSIGLVKFRLEGESGWLSNSGLLPNLVAALHWSALRQPEEFHEARPSSTRLPKAAYQRTSSEFCGSPSTDALRDKDVIEVEEQCELGPARGGDVRGQEFRLLEVNCWALYLWPYGRHLYVTTRVFIGSSIHNVEIPSSLAMQQSTVQDTRRCQWLFFGCYWTRA